MPVSLYCRPFPLVPWHADTDSGDFAGLFTKGVGRLEAYPFERAVGGDLAESGSGPGSYDVRGNVFHFNWFVIFGCSPPRLCLSDAYLVSLTPVLCHCRGNPEIKTNGWAMVAQAICGWNNNGTVGTVVAYSAYWWTVAASVFLMKWREGRLGDTPWSAARKAAKGPSASRPRRSESSD